MDGESIWFLWLSGMPCFLRSGLFQIQWFARRWRCSWGRGWWLASWRGQCDTVIPAWVHFAVDPAASDASDDVWAWFFQERKRDFARTKPGLLDSQLKSATPDSWSYNFSRYPYMFACILEFCFCLCVIMHSDFPLPFLSTPPSFRPLKSVCPEAAEVVTPTESDPCSWSSTLSNSGDVNKDKVNAAFIEFLALTVGKWCHFFLLIRVWFVLDLHVSFVLMLYDCRHPPLTINAPWAMSFFGKHESKLYS